METRYHYIVKELLRALDVKGEITVMADFGYYGEHIRLTKVGDKLGVHTRVVYSDTYPDGSQETKEVVDPALFVEFMNNRLFAEEVGMMSGRKFDVRDYLQSFTDEVRHQANKQLLAAHAAIFMEKDFPRVNKEVTRLSNLKTTAGIEKWADLSVFLDGMVREFAYDPDIGYFEAVFEHDYNKRVKKYLERYVNTRYTGMDYSTEYCEDWLKLKRFNK